MVYPKYAVIDENADIINDHFSIHNFDHLPNEILQKHK